MRLLAIAGAVTAVLALAPIAQAQVQAQEQPPRFVVNGVVVKPDGSALAWLQEPTFIKGVMLVRAGDSVGPYKVTGITEDRVELQGPAGKVIVRLYATATGGPVPAPKPVTPAAPTVVGGTPPPAAPPAPGTLPAASGAAISAPPSVAVQPADGTEDKKPSPGGPAIGGRHGSEPLVSNSPLIGTPLFPASGEATAQEKAAAAARSRVPINQGFGFGAQGSGSAPSK